MPIEFSHLFLGEHVRLGHGGKPGENMNAKLAWPERYRDAPLELPHQESPRRINGAEKATLHRIRERRQGGWESEEKSRALDTLRGLRVLTRPQCDPPQSNLSDLTPTEAAS